MRILDHHYWSNVLDLTAFKYLDKLNVCAPPHASLLDIKASFMDYFLELVYPCPPLDAFYAKVFLKRLVKLLHKTGKIYIHLDIGCLSFAKTVVLMEVLYFMANIANAA